MDKPIDPAAVMAAHKLHIGYRGRCYEPDADAIDTGPCEPYRLAAKQAKVVLE